MKNLLLIFAVAGVFGLVGCAGTGSRDAGLAMILTDVPLKENGPNQVTPASSTLHRGDRVSVRCDRRLCGSGDDGSAAWLCADGGFRRSVTAGKNWNRGAERLGFERGESGRPG
jgi:hypothetical protein